MQADSVSISPGGSTGTISRPDPNENSGTADSESGESRASDPAQSDVAARNRRQYPRYTALKDRIWLGWWADEEFFLVEATLINISRGGVLISSNPAPNSMQPVWIRLEGSPESESVKAFVLETKWMLLKRRYSIRLAFQQPCPDDFYENAVYGQPLPRSG